MPKIVVDDFGGQRSDPGMLGSGIYFASSARYSLHESNNVKNKSKSESESLLLSYILPVHKLSG